MFVMLFLMVIETLGGTLNYAERAEVGDGTLATVVLVMFSVVARKVHPLTPCVQDTIYSSSSCSFSFPRSRLMLSNSLIS